MQESPPRCPVEDQDPAQHVDGELQRVLDLHVGTGACQMQQLARRRDRALLGFRASRLPRIGRVPAQLGLVAIDCGK